MSKKQSLAKMAHRKMGVDSDSDCESPSPPKPPLLRPLSRDKTNSTPNLNQHRFSRNHSLKYTGGALHDSQDFEVGFFYLDFILQ